MNKRIFSLCMILFILIICTTVNAQEVTQTNNTTIDNSQDSSINTVITTTQTASQEVISDTTQDSAVSSDKTTAVDTTDTNIEQSVQGNDDDENLIIKKNSSEAIVKEEDIENSNINITGIITVAYDKENKTYAADESEGFLVEGANIILTDLSSGNVVSTTSDNEGYYQFTDLTPGNYTIVFTYSSYANESIDLKLTASREVDYLFVPDIAIITFSGDSTGSGQIEKSNKLREISDRFYFLESYELNNSYDRSSQWMLDYANFILVDMFSIGNGFGVDTDLIAGSPASRNNKIAYVFGIFDSSIFQGTLAQWGFLGNNPHSLENTYVGSYWQVFSTNSTTIATNMVNLYSYIRYLLNETSVDPTTTGNGPIFTSNSWGIYYPGFEGNVKTPSAELVNQWIRSNPGYNADGAGSLNWIVEDYSVWNLENNDPKKVLRDFEDWYTENVDINGSFIVISTYYEGGPVVDAMIEEYEKQGRAVFSLYKTTSEDPDMTALLEMVGNKTIITRGVVAVSYMYWWTTGYAQRGGNYTINAYKNLNVSLINALKDISQYGYESEFGPQNEWTAAVTMPEFEGVYGVVPVSYLNDNKETVVIQEGIEKHVQLTNGWAKLKELNNSDKKVSIIVYGYPPGRANIGASYLDVFQSIHDLLEHLSDAGYDIGMNKSDIPTTEELNNIITDFSNKGLWAEGLLDQYVISHYDDLTEHGQLVSKSQYYEWYYKLPVSLQEHVTQSWGDGLGNGSMIYREKAEINKTDLSSWLSKLSEEDQDQFRHYWQITDREIVLSEDSEIMLVNKTNFYKWLADLPTDLQLVFNDSFGSQLLDETNYRDEGYYVIPGEYFGNIFLSVQPMRGWESQIDFHSSDLSPPQQYIAYYKYLSQIAQMDAVIHMGTHGTLEWLPGRTMGLQSTDWPFQLTELPIIYPYIVSNPGEGMTAKERSFAQIITHMTPVTTSSSLYGDYVELNDAISRYDSNKLNGVEDNVEYYQAYILNLTESLGYDQPDYITVSKAIDDYNIALINEDAETIETAKKKLIQQATILGYVIPSDEGFDEELEKVVEYVNSNEAFDEWLSHIHDDIEAMSADKINFGTHTLGKVWNDTELINGVISIVSSRTTILDNIMKLYYPNITESYYDKIKDRSFNEEKEIINGIVKNIVTNIVEGADVDEEAAKYGVFNKSSDFYQDFLSINETVVNLLNNMEWESILTALGGGYVEPGLSADPLYSDVLPTGRAMYASDSTKIPSKSAWQSAVNSIDQTLIKYMVDLGEESFPDMVGEVIWGTEALRTEGISLAQFLYLLGVKPVWDQTGTVVGAEVIPLEDLTLTINGTVYSRPRIDVFATIVSNNPGWIGLLTEAVSMVNDLDEPFELNYVKKHYNETGSLERLFGLPGAVLEGTGVSDLLNNAGTRLNESYDIAGELASVYEARIGHSWNLDEQGNIVVKDDASTFAYLLEHVTLVIQNLDSTWRYLDTDDYVDWFGGLVNAANVHGQVVNTVLLDIRDKNNVITSTLGEEVKKETRTTILNPQWLNGMTTDVGGWNQMSQNFENLMKTMLTTQEYKENQAGRAIKDTSEGNNAGIIGDGLLKELAELVTYSEYFTIDAQYKSYSFQSMVGWLLTSDMAGYWKTNNDALRKDMLQKYVDNANRYGVACCHHTCGNINFHSWIIKTGAALGVKGLSEYSKIYASATKNPSAVYSESSTSESSASTEGTGTVDINQGVSEYLNNGATSEANAMANAGAGATGLSDLASIIGEAFSMTQSRTESDGTGSGGSGEDSNTNGTGSGSGNGTTDGNGTSSGNGTGSGDEGESGSGTGTGETTPSDSNSTSSDTNATENTNGTSGDSGNQNSNSTDTGNGTATDDNQNQTVEPVDDNQNQTVEPVEDTNQTVEPVDDTNQTVEPVDDTNQTVEPVDDTNQTENPVDENQTVEPEVPVDDTNQTEEPADENQTVTPDVPNQPDTNTTTEPDNTTVVNTDDDGHNGTVVDGDNSGAGETPSEGEAEGESAASSEGASAASSEGASADVSQTTTSSSSSSSPTVNSGSSSAGEESGSVAGKESVYEVVQKNIGKPPASESEIAIWYLIFVVGILLIFFFGFTRPNSRSK